MPRANSNALEVWKTRRCEALDSLEAIHGHVTGERRGRQYATEHLNLALFVRLAAEFQGFCRNLHDDAAFVLVSSLDLGNDPRMSVIRNALVRNRNLDKGNAHPGTLGNDFAILGMTFWPDIHAAYTSRGAKWRETMTDLNEVRNAVAHSDDAKLAVVKQKQPLNLATFRKWRRSLDGAASGLDRAVEAYLQSTADAGWETL
ncbi:hypothetical protein [Nocardia jiangxiensis]|uniref:hypothetical protein n=1 Tax=Nocardia jiangxiensis TaxID=282685 RepID=UPI001469FB0A|nr:hypothetical protein [Nocardia jiangxiensis]